MSQVTLFKLANTHMDETQQNIITWLEGVWSDLVTKQNDYFLKNKYYWQAPDTHKEPPATPTTPDNLNSKVTQYKNESTDSWKKQFISVNDPIESQLPASLRIDVREEAGAVKGWSATVTANIDEEIWSCTRDGISEKYSEWELLTDLAI